MIKEVNAIDIHSHFNHGAKYDSPNSERDGISCSELDFLMQEYDNTNVLCGGFSSFSSVLSDQEIYEENSYLFDLSKKNERVFQWVVIDPRQEKTFEQADEILKSEKCLGLKIHPYFHKYDIDEYADKLFSYANEKKATVLVHPTVFDNMASHANKYPDMNMILAHLGSKKHVEAVLAAKYGNIYVDTSGSVSYQNNIIEYAVKHIGSEKILFGTDTYSCAFQRGRIVYARIADKDKENILFNNAKRLFSKKFASYSLL